MRTGLKFDLKLFYEDLYTFLLEIKGYCLITNSFLIIKLIYFQS